MNMVEYRINPKTGRKIKVGGATDKQLTKPPSFKASGEPPKTMSSRNNSRATLKGYQNLPQDMQNIIRGLVHEPWEFMRQFKAFESKPIYAIIRKSKRTHLMHGGKEVLFDTTMKHPYAAFYTVGSNGLKDTINISEFIKEGQAKKKLAVGLLDWAKKQGIKVPSGMKVNPHTGKYVKETSKITKPLSANERMRMSEYW